MEIKKEAYEADLALLDRFQAFSAELIRISLLGIGLLGFVFEKAPMRNPISIAATIAATVTFALSASFALGHRYFSSDGVFYHLKALRTGDLLERKASEGYRINAYKRSEKLLLAAVVAAVIASLCAGTALVGVATHLQ